MSVIHELVVTLASLDSLYEVIISFELIQIVGVSSSIVNEIQGTLSMLTLLRNWVQAKASVCLTIFCCDIFNDWISNIALAAKILKRNFIRNDLIH